MQALEPDRAPPVLVEPASESKRLSDKTYAKWEAETDWLFFKQSNRQQRDKMGQLFTKKIAHCVWCEELANTRVGGI